MGFRGCWDGLAERTCWKYGSVVLKRHLDHILPKDRWPDHVIPWPLWGSKSTSRCWGRGRALNLVLSLERPSCPGTGQATEFLLRKAEGGWGGAEGGEAVCVHAESMLGTVLEIKAELLSSDWVICWVMITQGVAGVQVEPQPPGSPLQGRLAKS